MICEKCKSSRVLIKSNTGEKHCLNCGWVSGRNEYKKTQTNADRIQSMSIEELAEFIVGLNDHCLAGIGLCDCSKEKETTCEKICMRKTREWLQSEVEE